MIDQIILIEALLKERFAEVEKAGFGFSIEPDARAIGKVWVVTFKYGEVVYQIKGQDRERAFKVAMQAVLDDSRTRVSK